MLYGEEVIEKGFGLFQTNHYFRVFWQSTGKNHCGVFPDKCGAERRDRAIHNSLGAAIGMISSHNLLVVLGDFNAHLGVDDAT